MPESKPNTTSDEPLLDSKLPQYLVESVERQSPERLLMVAKWARELAEYKSTQVEEEARRAEIDNEQKVELEERGIDVDPADYEDVPANPCITTKTIKGNGYYYWQWRDGKSIKSEYIAPVNPKS